MLIKDYLLFNDIEVKVLDSKRIDDECTWYEVAYDDLKFAVLEYPDGTIYTQRDWQGIVVQPDEIGDEQWIDSTPDVEEE